MASRPCPVALTGCPGVDSPITNVSAEAPDPLEFASMVWTPNPRINPALGNGLDIPTECTPAQQNFFSSLPAIVIESPESQLYANLLALATELGCAFPPSTGEQQYMNDEQCAVMACESGAQFSYCVPAGTLISGLLSPDMGAAWVVAANDWALAYAQQQASAIMDCSGGGQEQPETPPGDHPPTIPSGPGINTNAGWMCFGEAFFARTTISGGSTSAYSMSVSAGVLAPGTTFVQDGPRTGYVSGTPTAPGAYSYTIRGVSTTLPNMTVQITNYLFVMGITNASSLSDATTGAAYSEALTSDGGTAPYTYALDAGSSLPTGLTLATNGTISGTPTADGDFTFDVVLADANGGECVQTVLLTVAVGLNPTAWWTMEVGGPLPPIADVINSIPLNHVTGNTGLYTKEAGIVAQAWQLRNAGLGVAAVVQTPSSAFLYMTDSGITIAWWNYWNTTDLTDLSAMGVRYSFQIGVTTHDIIVYQWPGWIEIEFDFVTVLTPPSLSQNTWHFLALRYDRSTDTLSLDIDQSANYSAILAPLPLGPYSNSFLQLIDDQSGGGVFFCNARFDEIAFFQEVLTTAQLDSIYNGGSGRTWP